MQVRPEQSIPLHDAECDAVADLLKAQPTTLPGAIAMIEWAAAAEADDAPLPDDWYQDSLRRMARALKRMAAASPGVA